MTSGEWQGAESDVRSPRCRIENPKSPKHSSTRWLDDPITKPVTSDEWRVTRKGKTQERKGVQGEILRKAQDDSAAGGDDSQTPA